ncbi:hypothetical protein NP493_934g00000 [Ridgeia piscesae]|uniref:Vesicle transport through interaction with t-SNAREs homolog 1A n=1 Tax=Ridgeia piscesae TaxID=27915 RepID=A0AAD9KKC2_RIDPI|nr:hypothetical protein NP493_934g00000 [Ridgeia piscesae]
MASLMESYEQQYSNLTAEIVSHTGKIPNLSGSDKSTEVSHVERLLDETHELLEQMELEVRGLPPADRQKYQTRLKSYQAELATLEKELKKARIAFSDTVHSREELLGMEEGHQSEDQRARLLDNSERLERVGKKIDHGYRTCIETEQIGEEILGNLHSQRETIQRSRNRLRDTNEALGQSSRVLSGMMRRMIQNRIFLVALSVALVIIIGVALYFATRRT